MNVLLDLGKRIGLAGDAGEDSSEDGLLPLGGETVHGTEVGSEQRQEEEQADCQVWQEQVVPGKRGDLHRVERLLIDWKELHISHSLYMQEV